jgi:hypothetical protein
MLYMPSVHFWMCVNHISIGAHNSEIYEKGFLEKN